MYRLTDHPDHAAALPAHTKTWIDNALSTAPADQPAATAAIRGLYAAAGLTPPPREVFVRSPLTAHIAGGVAAGIWWLRENPDRHADIAGRRLGEADLMALIPVACQMAVGAGMDALAGITTATAAATYNATDAATAAATRAATAAATYNATRAATDAATYNATDAATYDATYDATAAATAAATYNATYNATRAATAAATYNATAAATDAATYDATAAATYNATRAATYNATDAATDNATYNATAAATRAATRFLLECVTQTWRMHDGGSDWSSWPAHLSAYDRVYHLNLPIFTAWRHYEQAALTAASRIMHGRFWIASDRHTSIHMDTQARLHNPSGPSRAWADGWALWHWHGTPVPADLIEHGWDTTRILREPNAEIRRCAIERMGWDEFTTQAGLAQVGATVPDPGNPGQHLALYDVPERIYGDSGVRVLLCANGTPERDGTHRRFGLIVPSDIGDPLTAAAWGYGLTAAEYATTARRA